MEITQFTYFQQVGSLNLDLESVELTYGLERIAMYLQNVNSVYDIEWAPGITYGDIFLQPEYEHSVYSFDESDVEVLKELFSVYESEAQKYLEKNLVYPAYDNVLKCSHTFNVLDARGAVSVSERAVYIGRVRNLARIAAIGYVNKREELGFPLLAREVAHE